MQSLYNKLDSLAAFLEEIRTYHALCLTETWLSEEKLQLVSLCDYTVASSFCRLNYAGGGVCIFLRSDLEYTERKDIMDLSIGYVVEISAIEISDINVLLIVVY